MINVQKEINQGEIKIIFNSPIGGKFSFADLGLEKSDLEVAGGNFRLDIELKQFPDHHFYKMPTIELAYLEREGDTLWVVEFNDTNVLEKSDHGGKSTVMLLDRKKLEGLVHHHENRLVIHGDFSQKVHIDPNNSWIHLLEVVGSVSN